MAFLQRVQHNLKATSQSVTVPDDPVARLMYYLDCMCVVLRMNDNPDIQRLRQFQRYYTLSHMDRNVLVNLCMVLKPDELLNKCIFQNDALCQGSANKFYDFETVRNNLLVAGSVMIGGRNTQVTKIMTFKMSWLQNNWIRPMQEVMDRQVRERQAMMQQPRRGAMCVIQ